jgi:hypothetical protein
MRMKDSVLLVLNIQFYVSHIGLSQRERDKTIQRLLTNLNYFVLKRKGRRGRESVHWPSSMISVSQILCCFLSLSLRNTQREEGGQTETEADTDLALWSLYRRSCAAPYPRRWSPGTGRVEPRSAAPAYLCTQKNKLRVCGKKQEWHIPTLL